MTCAIVPALLYVGMMTHTLCIQHLILQRHLNSLICLVGDGNIHSQHILIQYLFRKGIDRGVIRSYDLLEPDGLHDTQLQLFPIFLF